MLSLKHICLTKYSNSTELPKNLKVMWSLNSPTVTINISLPSICFLSSYILCSALFPNASLSCYCQFPSPSPLIFSFFSEYILLLEKQNKTKTHLRQRVAVYEHAEKKKGKFLHKKEPVLDVHCTEQNSTLWSYGLDLWREKSVETHAWMSDLEKSGPMPMSSLFSACTPKI